MDKFGKISITLRAGGNCVDVRPLFSLDSKFLFIASGWSIKVFSTISGECVRRLYGHKSNIVSLQHNQANAVQIVSASEDGTIIYWDYTDGIQLKTIKVPETIKSINAFYIARDKAKIYITSSKDSTEKGVLYCLKPKREARFKVKHILQDIQTQEHNISFSRNGQFVAAICENFLQIFFFDEKKAYKHYSNMNFTCVTCHSQDSILATGDVLGRIFIWGNLNSNKPTKSIYHWHTLPVSDLAFSIEGNYLYSGGGECVLVKWNIQAEDKSFVPRLGLPICQISVASDNSFIATGHADNAICLLTPQNQVVQQYQGLCQGHPWKDLLESQSRQFVENPVPTGLIYDTKSRALVLNGKPGHIQFYSVHYDKQLFCLDISGQNYVSRERERVIPNTVVEKVALNSKSNWMATVQCRDDRETSIEIVLKFWNWNEKSQIFSLNTTVLLPHNQKINSLIYQPSDDLNPLVVSTSSDGKFKIWALEDKDYIQSEIIPKATWQCVAMGYYRNHPAGDADFSEDGSVLAIAFGHAATLWVPENAGLKAILSVPVNDAKVDAILQLKFGFQDCSHLLVTTTQHNLYVWNVVSLSILWQVEMNVNFLMKNPKSNVMAIFNKEGTFFAFKPSDPKPIHTIEQASKFSVIAGVFMPERGASKDCYLDGCSIYFMNEKQELMVISSEKETLDNYQPIFNGTEKTDISEQPKTHFGALLAQQKKSEVEQFESEHQLYQKGNLGKKMFQELINIPSHTVPAVNTLCLDFMTSLLIER